VEGELASSADGSSAPPIDSSRPTRRLAFHCPGDAFFKVYRHPALRPVVDVLKGMALVQSVGASGLWAAKRDLS
jgi:hypothetical protein